MPKRADIHKIMIFGSGLIILGLLSHVKASIGKSIGNKEEVANEINRG
ncbi:MAG: hypothetical protein JRJ77_03410 [Deltaproteobacteria bacterium]|nr:hypothetical protein [Deltaproteobacteria bacterium]MBW2339578.1 hypothetical protein [Deltaproteobacteria bacterium]